MDKSRSHFGARAIGVILVCFLLVASGMGTAAGADTPQAVNRYVAKYGSDAGPNNCLNQASPCLTILHAIGQAGPDDNIYVAQGTYVETLNIDQPLDLMGGFQENTWVYDPAQYETTIDGSNSREVAGDWDGDKLGIPTVIVVPGGYRMWYDAENLIYGWQSGIARFHRWCGMDQVRRQPGAQPCWGSTLG